MNRFTRKIQAFVEVEVGPCNKSVRTSIQTKILNFLNLYPSNLIYGIQNLEIFADTGILPYVKQINIIATNDDTSLSAIQTYFTISTYRMYNELPAQEEAEEENISLCTQWILPNTCFKGLWESLYYESRIKDELLDYAATALLYADKRVDDNIICWNRMVLLHGPPGTGKTSLARAVAQKLAIRLANRFSCGQLIEVNAHSLFSKWFSESGKLVLKLFQKIHDLLEDTDSFVVVLIDEVESLAAARSAAATGTEPSDAIRVVNALLTQVDSLKQYHNTLTVTTSNITQAIDLAFVDRADIKKFIPLPNTHCRYEVLRSCLLELIRAEILIENENDKLVEFNNLETVDPCLTPLSSKLRSVAEKLDGLSGRALRKLPLQAHFTCLKGTSPVDVKTFIDAMEETALKEKSDRLELNKLNLQS